MTIYEYGNPDADTVLIQLTGDHELSVLKNEVEEIRKRTSTDFRLIAAKLMTGIMSCLHGKHRQCSEMKTLVMSQVGNCIRMGYGWLIEHGINCNLEWNQGNHFREPDIRIAKAFAWVMEGK